MKLKLIARNMSRAWMQSVGYVTTGYIFLDGRACGREHRASVWPTEAIDNGAYPAAAARNRPELKSIHQQRSYDGYQTQYR